MLFHPTVAFNFRGKKGKAKKKTVISAKILELRKEFFSAAARLKEANEKKHGGVPVSRGYLY